MIDRSDMPPVWTLREVVEELYNAGWLHRSGVLSDNCVMSTPTVTWRHVCRIASEFTRGNWHPMHNGIRWEVGKHSYYMISRESVPELQRARNIVKTVTGTDAGWSFGNCATKLIKWSLMELKPSPRDMEIQRGNYIGYHICYPGRYSDGKLWDVSSCYFQLISRLPSPRVNIDITGSLSWKPMTADETVKWQEVLNIVESEKLLRNSMWGCMLGSSERKTHYFRGKEVISNRYFGTHYTAAALVGRSAWELCREAAEETDACYAQTDGIVTATDKRPHIWEKVGLSYKLHEHGDTHTVHQHNYKCGNKVTEYYDGSDRFARLMPMAPAPDMVYYRHWL